MFDVTKFVGDVHEYIERIVSPLAARIKALEARPLAEKGDRGTDGRNGTDGNHGRDGQDGKDGRDAVVSYDDILKAVEETHERLVAKHILDLERRGMDAIQRAIDKLPVPKDGKDGLNGKDGRDAIDGKDGKDGLNGKDGVGVESLTREYDPASHEIVERWAAGSITKELRYPAGGLRPGGYWKEGTKALSGQAWTKDGVLWIAIRDTSDVPSRNSADWFIGARKGKDGIDGRNGKDAPGPVKL